MSTKANIHLIAALCINKVERSDNTGTDCGSHALIFHAQEGDKVIPCEQEELAREQ